MPNKHTPTTWKQKLLGVVVLLQFTAVLASNVGGFVDPLPDSTTGETALPKSKPLHYLRFAADRYCEATGQMQGWGMFDSGRMINEVWFEIIFNMPYGDTVKVRSVAGGPRNSWIEAPASLNRRFVYECYFTGYELVSEPLSREFMDEVRINNVAYERLFISRYADWRRDHPAAPEKPVDAVLRTHWQPLRDHHGLSQSGFPCQQIICRWNPQTDASHASVEAYIGRISFDKPVFKSFDKSLK